MNHKAAQVFVLKESIRVWKKNLRDAKKREEIRLGATNCPCCKVYISDGCEKCPIKEHVGVPECRDTPYSDVLRLSVLTTAAYIDPDEIWSALENAVEKELAFLETVLETL